MFPIACQTITWGEGQSKQFPEVFDQVKAAGYPGVEIGIRHIQRSSPAEVRRLLDERGLEFVALHLGGNLLDPSQARRERQVIDDALDTLKTLGGRLLMYSGLRYKDVEQFAMDFNMLNESAEKCEAQGVRLLYHNHSFEFADNARVMRALFRDSSRSLGFCPDIGWVMRGGMDVIECLEAMSGRIGAVHFKDFSDKGNTVLLGTGVAPLKQAADWLKLKTNGMWVIAEQDRTRTTPAEAARQNALYLKKLFP